MDNIVTYTYNDLSEYGYILKVYRIDDKYIPEVEDLQSNVLISTAENYHTFSQNYWNTLKDAVIGGCIAIIKYIMDKYEILLPFNIEAAKKGHAVCTRDKRPARIICFDRIGYFKIIALVKEKNGIENTYYYNNFGHCLSDRETINDLMLLSKPLTNN